MTKRRSLSPTAGILSFSESGGIEREHHRHKASNEILRSLLRSISEQTAKMEKAEAPLSSPKDIKSEKSAVEEKAIPQIRASIDKERCVRCGICADVCPAHAVVITEEVMINSNRCNGCGTCVDECPNEAISLS
jgi:ferredoxin